MKTNIYSVYDKKAECFSQPFNMVNDAVAMRVIKNCVRDKTHNYGQNPEDYALYKIGTFDDVVGELEQEQSKIMDLITCTEYQQEKDENKIDFIEQNKPRR